jgi:zinc transporter, ZIP family
VLNAFLISVLAQAPLVIGGLLVYWYKVPAKWVGWLGGYGAGALFSAIAFDLIPGADVLSRQMVVVWLMVGALVFAGLDHLIEQRFGERAGALGIVLGSIIDGVPECVIFGVQIATGVAISTAFLAAVMVSNIPQSIAPSADLAVQGEPKRKVARMWVLVVAICALAGGVAYAFGVRVPGATGAAVSAFAAGGLICMLVTSLIPFSFERGGLIAGIWAVAGFAMSFLQQQ